MTNTLRAGVYGRESKDSGASVEHQTDRGLTVVAEQGWRLVGQWADGVGASRQSRKRRKGWPEVRAAIEAGDLDVLVVAETSRADRKARDWLDLLNVCRERGVKIHVINDETTYDPRRATHYKTLANAGVDAEHETNRLAERVSIGTAAAASRGGIHGSTPFGYRRAIVGTRRTARGEERPTRGQMPDETTAPVVKDIITRVAARDSLMGIARGLTERGVPAPRGGAAWSPETIRRIVRNRSYIGQRVHRPVDPDRTAAVYPGTWPAIVSETIWTAANAVLDEEDRYGPGTKPGGVRHLLSSILLAPCGAVLVADRPKGQRPRYICKADSCVGIPEADADAWVTEVVISRLSKPDARSIFVTDDRDAMAALDELARLEAKLAEARASFRRIDGRGISADALAETERELAPLVDDARRRSRPRGVPLALLLLLDAATMGREHVRPAWDALPLAGRRELIRLLCESITVHRARHRLTRWASDDERRDHAAARVAIRLLDGDVIGGP